MLLARALAAEGLGVVARDMEEMRQAIKELTTNRPSWLATSARCVAFMRREYTEDRIFAPYLKTSCRLTDQPVGA